MAQINAGGNLFSISRRRSTGQSQSSLVFLSPDTRLRRRVEGGNDITLTGEQSAALRSRRHFDQGRALRRPAPAYLRSPFEVCCVMRAN